MKQLPSTLLVALFVVLFVAPWTPCTAQPAEPRTEAYARERGLPLFVNQFDAVGSPRRIKVFFSVTNISEKTSKRITVHFAGFNEVGRKLGEYTASVERLVEPGEPGGSMLTLPQGAAGYFRCAEARRMEVEFIDGSRFVFVNDLRDATMSDVRLRGDCAVQ